MPRSEGKIQNGESYTYSFNHNEPTPCQALCWVLNSKAALAWLLV